MSDVLLPGNGPAPPSDEFAAGYGEPLDRVLDPRAWQPADQLDDLYRRLDEEVDEALRQADATKLAVRQHIFGRIEEARLASRDLGDEIGFYAATPELIRRQHFGLLFRGGVEAADGTSVAHDTLPLTVMSIGVVLVSYDGSYGTWGHRLYRRDLRLRGMTPFDELVALLDRRIRENGHPADRHARLTQLGRSGIMAYMERAILLEMGRAPWRLGHGNPVSFPLLTGSGSAEFLRKSLDLLRRLIDFEKFVFVQSETTERDLLTIGDALRPLEYVVYDTAEDAMRRIVEAETYLRRSRDEAREFIDEYGPKLVRGVYRASEFAPPYVFYAHRERVHEAALIALADSTLHEHRGFPLLIDLADAVARAVFDPASIADLVRAAYAARGKPYRYLSERETR
ncbi:MAG: hypothetical protein RMM58_11825 [Chloroflexota bacterium]|nr:hypothetical protein [Dehalococcoidia bacterium]MDW8254554.1 hypothetical protein [Chloroflexota bacterium]